MQTSTVERALEQFESSPTFFISNQNQTLDKLCLCCSYKHGYCLSECWFALLVWVSEMFPWVLLILDYSKGTLWQKICGRNSPVPICDPPWDLFEVASTRWTCKLGLEIEHPPTRLAGKIGNSISMFSIFHIFQTSQD